MGKAKPGRGTMSCEVCGNDQGQCFEVLLGGEKHVFDCFECAMRAFAQYCDACGNQIVGHGIMIGNSIYCSSQCAHDAMGRDYERRVHLREQANL